MTTKNNIIEYLADNITYAIMLVSMIVLLTIVAQASIADSTVVEEKHQKSLIVEDDSLKATVDLTSGSAKPTINLDGTTVTEYSGWSSEIIVDGKQTNLWHHNFDYSKDAMHKRIYYSRGGDGYELKQTITVREDRAIIKYYIIPTGERKIDNVSLTIGHYRWYYSNVAIKNRSAILTYQNKQYNHTAKIDFNGNLENAYVNPTDNGPNYFTTTYTVSSPPTGEKTLIAHEVVHTDT